MPRIAINYQNGLIYKICSKDPLITDTYTGSTTNFMKRKQQHKCNCHNVKHKSYNYYVYKFIRENGGWDNWQMLELEHFPCNTQHELALRERYWLEVNVSTLNKNVPMRTIDEMPLLKRSRNAQYYKNNTNIIKQKIVEWRNNNTEHIKQYSANYYQNVRKPKRLAAAAIPDGYATT